MSTDTDDVADKAQRDGVEAVRRSFPSLEALSRLRLSLEPSLKIAEQLRTAYEPILAYQAEIARSVSRIHLPALDSVAKLGGQIAAMQAEFVRSYQPIFESLQRMMEELPPRTRNGLLVIGQNGWYMDLQMPFPVLWAVVDAFEKGEKAPADRILVDHYRNRLDAIEQDLAAVHPGRSSILSSALNAHKRGEYELAVPVLLAQADGICYEASGASLFRRRNGEAGTVALVRAATTQFQAALLAPLGETLPLRASESERDAGFSDLNRHQVLHGESLDYGTELNSYKAISLVLYVSQMVRSKENEDV